jgi:ribose transport system substrate-binding protein
MKKIVLGLVLVVGLIGSMNLWAAGTKEEAAGAKIKVTLITMDSIDEHWLKVKAGAQAKADELGNVVLTFNAPPGKVDAAVQLQMVEDAITKKANAIMLAPLNKDALSPGVEKAKAAGIPVIIIDSGVSTQNFDAFFSTDNGAAARLAADEMAKAIGGKGKVAIVNAQAGAGTTMTRENEFKAQMAAKYPGITIVGTQYSDGDKTKALNQATDFMTANPDLAGIYGCNEGATVGVGTAVEQAGKTGKVKVIGFDWSADTKALVGKGVVQASMVQNPYIMGNKGLQAAVDVVMKKPTQKLVDTGVTVATKANMDSIK